MKRIQIDLAFEDKVYATIPEKIMMAFKESIHGLLPYSVKINDGKSNEEATTSATLHTCHNDTQQPCKPEEVEDI